MFCFAQEPNKSSLSGLKKNWSRRWVIVFHWSSVLQHWLPLVLVMREIHWFWFGCFALSMSQHVSAWLDTSIPSRPQFWTAFHLSIRFARSGSQGNWSAQSGIVQQDTFWISAFQLEASKYSSTWVLSIRMVLFCLLMSVMFCCSRTSECAQWRDQASSFTFASPFGDEMTHGGTAGRRPEQCRKAKGWGAMDARFDVALSSKVYMPFIICEIFVQMRINYLILFVKSSPYPKNVHLAHFSCIARRPFHIQNFMMLWD